MEELSNEEKQALSNAEFFYLKDSITRKATTTLSGIERSLHSAISTSDFKFPKGTYKKAGKIAKGENYRLLPYVILDYPRLFSKDSVFAYRCMLWWGNHFSCTLHVGGDALNAYKETLYEKLVANEDLFFCVNTQPWDYHYGKDNYVPLNQLTPDAIADQINHRDFIKISNFISIDQWDQFESFALKNFARFLRCLY